MTGQWFQTAFSRWADSLTHVWLAAVKNTSNTTCSLQISRGRNFHVRKLLLEFGLTFPLEAGFLGLRLQMLLYAQPARQRDTRGATVRFFHKNRQFCITAALASRSSTCGKLTVLQESHISPDVWFDKLRCVELLSLISLVHVPRNSILFEPIPRGKKKKSTFYSPVLTVVR